MPESIHIPWLEDRQWRFPAVETALKAPDGLLAASQTLSPELIVDAYPRGIFPWYSEGQPVLWWSPDPRCVIFPERLHLSRRLRRTIRQRPCNITVDQAFRDVMLACAAPRRNRPDREDESGTWITAPMLENYCRLHNMGYAHSIECWRDGELVGGMYGIKIGAVFFGESMFSKMRDASKIAMHYLCTEIRPALLDAQVESPHLMRMGATLIPRKRFIELLRQHTGEVRG